MCFSKLSCISEFTVVSLFKYVPNVSLFSFELFPEMSLCHAPSLNHVLATVIALPMYLYVPYFACFLLLTSHLNIIFRSTVLNNEC